MKGMKNRKRPEEEIRKTMEEYGYPADEWEFIGEDNISITIRSRKTGERWVILC